MLSYLVILGRRKGGLLLSKGWKRMAVASPKSVAKARAQLAASSLHNEHCCDSIQNLS